MKQLDRQDVEQTQTRYHARFKEYGYSPKTLGWLKGKQDIRFDILTSLYNFEDKRVLDIGCGFGDLNKTLAQRVKAYSYFGIDLCEGLVGKGKEIFQAPYIEFCCGDFLAHSLKGPFDWAVASGIFNHKLAKEDNYRFIHAVMEKAHVSVTGGFSFDFICDNVDYRDDHIFYANPEKILSFAYTLSRRVVLRSDYMPFEFSVFVFKDDSFDKRDTVFSRYKDNG